MGKKSEESQKSKFVEYAREHGLDTEEAAEAFERAIKKITPPKRGQGDQATTDQNDRGE